MTGEKGRESRQEFKKKSWRAFCDSYGVNLTEFDKSEAIDAVRRSHTILKCQELLGITNEWSKCNYKDPQFLKVCTAALKALFPECQHSFTLRTDTIVEIAHSIQKRLSFYALKEFEKVSYKAYKWPINNIGEQLRTYEHFSSIERIDDSIDTTILPVRPFAL